MPQLPGGLDLGRSLRDAESIMSTVDALKKRRLKRENPLASSLGDVSQFQELLGESGTGLQENPQLLEQMLNMLDVQDPAKREQVGTFAKGLQSRVQRRRVIEFQKGLATTLAQIQQQKSHNAVMMTILQRAGKDDAEITAIREQFQIQDQILSRSLIQNLQLGYEDIMNVPEVQNLLKRVQIEAIVGPGAGGKPGTRPSGMSAPAPGGRPSEVNPMSPLDLMGMER